MTRVAIKEWEEKNVGSYYIQGIRQKLLFTMSYKPEKHTVVLSQRNITIKNNLLDSTLLFELSVTGTFPQLKAMLSVIANGNLHPEPNDTAKAINKKAQAFAAQVLAAASFAYYHHHQNVNVENRQNGKGQ